MLGKIWLITRREYRTRVRQRSFFVITLALALVGVLLATAPLIIAGIGGTRLPHAPAVAVLDAGNTGIAPLLTAHSTAATTPGDLAQTFPHLVLADTSLPTLIDRVNAGTLDGILIIGKDPAGGRTYTYATRAGTSDAPTTQLRAALMAFDLPERLRQTGISSAQYDAVTAPVPFVTQATQPPAGNADDANSGARLALAYVLNTLTYTAILVYGMWVGGGVAEEKSNRVMEVMMNAATPVQLMAGKIAGITAAALTQFSAILLPAGVVLALESRIALAVLGSGRGRVVIEAGLAAIVVRGMGAFLGFFLLGFLLYAALYAAAGSTVSRQEDVQQIALPMTLVVMTGLFVALFALSAPDGAFARVASFIPLFSPLVMPTRVIVGHPAPWEVAVSLALLTLAVVGMLVLAARVYRVGVLLYGERVSLRRVWQLSRTATVRNPATEANA